MKVAFFDRDGTINVRIKDDWVRSWDQFEIVPNALEAMGLLVQAGYKIILITNQRGISIERLTWEELGQLHEKLHAEMQNHGAGIEAAYICPHDRDADCPCRKPKSGMILQALSDYPEINLEEAIMFGDKEIDEQCAHGGGIKNFYYVDEKVGFLDTVEKILHGDI